MMALTKQRTKRFEYAAPATFWWSPAEGFLHSSNGVTRNIGSNGVLIETGECPPAGVHIQVTVYLPRVEGSGYAMKLHGEGLVVRVEGGLMGSDEQPTAFAASVQFYPEQLDGSEQPGKSDASLAQVLRSVLRNCS
jgi:hypothetical protein